MFREEKLKKKNQQEELVTEPAAARGCTGSRGGHDRSVVLGVSASGSPPRAKPSNAHCWVCFIAFIG